jgi:hypothetical protein
MREDDDDDDDANVAEAQKVEYIS